MATSIELLTTQWRRGAETLRKWGAGAQAAVLESCAEELDTVLREHELEALTLHGAMEESGYSYSAIQKMVAKGRVPNVGDKTRPRVRRGDLPRKPGRLPRGPSGEPDLAGTILAGG